MVMPATTYADFAFRGFCFASLAGPDRRFYLKATACMDSLLVIGSQDAKLDTFLKRLGYQVTKTDETGPLTEVIHSAAFDLMIVDSRGNKNAVEFCEFLRSSDATRQIPVVCISESPAERYALKELGLENIDLVDSPYSIGRLAANIATQLRIAKFKGMDERTASLTQMNAALRELNKRFSKELDEARAIQLGLLPKKLPEDARFSMAASYHPLTEVGGDWYHVSCGSSGKYTIQIADVTGHGLSAAFIGSMAKLALAAAAEESPEKLLQKMNALITPQLPEGRFVTVSSILFDPQSGQVDCARAGHPPALILERSSGKIRELKPQGFPLGFMDDAEYVCESTKLNPGDVLLLITDGLSEAQNRAHVQYGMERISQSLKAVPADAHANAILQSVEKDFRKFLDGRQVNDDVTLLVLEMRAS
jgi:sigma-B regulation protein RsbU (phosphoserine phosphatase)